MAGEVDWSTRNAVKLVLLMLETWYTLEMSLLTTSAYLSFELRCLSSSPLSLILPVPACLEAFHAHLGDLIRVQMEPSPFTGPSGLRNARVCVQENSFKTFTLISFPHLTAP